MCSNIKCTSKDQSLPKVASWHSSLRPAMFLRWARTRSTKSSEHCQTGFDPNDRAVPRGTMAIMEDNHAMPDAGKSLLDFLKVLDEAEREKRKQDEE